MNRLRITYNNKTFFIVNRLDEDESGLVIFAKSSLYKEYLVKNWNSFGVIYNITIFSIREFLVFSIATIC